MRRRSLLALLGLAGAAIPAQSLAAIDADLGPVRIDGDLLVNSSLRSDSISVANVMAATQEPDGCNERLAATGHLVGGFDPGPQTLID